MGPDADGDDVARLRRGDTSGLAGLLGRHEERLFRYLLRLLGDEAVAEDCFQQTWLRVAERIRQYDSTRPFAPWLHTIARNLALDHLRRFRPESLDDERTVAPAAPVEAGDDPLVHAVARQRAERLSGAVARLGPLDREVLSLRFDEDLPLPELAQALGVPVPTAKARLYRALARLREALVAALPAEEWR